MCQNDIAWCKNQVQHFDQNVCFSLDSEYSKFKSTLFGVSNKVACKKKLHFKSDSKWFSV